MTGCLGMKHTFLCICMRDTPQSPCHTLYSCKLLTKDIKLLETDLCKIKFSLFDILLTWQFLLISRTFFHCLNLSVFWLQLKCILKILKFLQIILACLFSFICEIRNRFFLVIFASTIIVDVKPTLSNMPTK